MSAQSETRSPSSPRAVTTATITFIRPDGQREPVEAEIGDSVMDAAVCNGIDEIVAECGGSLTCATCHVYVEEGGDPAPDRSPDEDEMLDCTSSPRTSSSRLSCQLEVTPEMDGLVVRLPETQQ